MTTTGRRAEDILREVELISATLVSILNPKADEISQREAGREFGVRWILVNTENGNLSYRTNGTGPNSKKIYSRKQIACLRAAEVEAANAILR